MRVESCALVDDVSARDSRATAARGDGSGPGGHRRAAAASARATGPDAGIKARGNASVSAGRRCHSTGCSPPPVITPPEPPRAGPPPELRPAGPEGRTPTAAQVRDRLVRTRQKLDSIDRGRLNAGKRTDYDSARRFLLQADAAVKDNNLLLAESSVEKAETLADGLK